MALAVNFRWKTPNIMVQQNPLRQNGWNDAITAGTEAIINAKERKYNRERQEKLDQWAEDDRTQRLADEQRKRNVYNQVAESIRGRKQERDQLVAEAEQIKQQIAMLKQQIGG